MKITVDTNTLVSASFWKGNEHKIIELVEQGKVDLILSPDILTEFEGVISRPTFHLPREEVIGLSNKIISISKLVSPTVAFDVCRDKEDNKILECAYEGKVDYIISGDEDLLSLKEFKGIEIIRSAKFLRLI